MEEEYKTRISKASLPIIKGEIYIRSEQIYGNYLDELEDGSSPLENMIFIFALITFIITFRHFGKTHWDLFSVFVTALVYLGASATALILIEVFVKKQKAYFLQDGIYVTTKVFFDYYDWYFIPWDKVAKLDVRKNVSILYSGHKLNQNLIFVKYASSNKLKGLADRLFVDQHQGEIPKTVTIVS